MPYANLTAEAKTKAGIVTNPYSFTVRKAAIEVIGEGDDRVAWRYNMESELAVTNDFKSFLILKVAKEARSVILQCALRVTPCKHSWLVFRDELREMPYNMDIPVELIKEA
jgi:hypothetical protein